MSVSSQQKIQRLPGLRNSNAGTSSWRRISPALAICPSACFHKNSTLWRFTMARAADSYAEVYLGTEEAPDPIELDPRRPFRILLVGDFSGRSWRDNASPALTPHAIDRDNFDQVLDRLNIRLDLDGLSLAFRELDDFHPDRIYQHLDVFQHLDRIQIPDEPPAAPAPPPSAAAMPAGAGLLDQI